MIPWEEVYDTTTLLEVRARALERRDEDLEEVRLYLRRIREKSKEHFNKKRRLRAKVLEPGMLVLCYNAK